MSAYDFQIGDWVSYRPPNEPNRPAEIGQVTAWNPSFVFVRYGTDTTSKATLPEALTRLGTKEKNNGNENTDQG